MRLFLAFVLALLSMSSTTAQARPVEGVPCARASASATYARGELQGHNGGLLYAQQRWLDPSTGRFLSLDPVAGSLSDPLSTQGFTYAHANPTRYTDPDGRLGLLATGALGAGIGAILGGVTGGIASMIAADELSIWVALDGALSGAAYGAGTGAAIGSLGTFSAGAALIGGALATSGVVGIAAVEQVQARGAEHYDQELVNQANADTFGALVAVATLGYSARAVLKPTTKSSGGQRNLGRDYENHGGEFEGGEPNVLPEPEGRIVWRAINPKDVETLDAGEGITAKDPTAKKTTLEHVLHADAPAIVPDPTFMSQKTSMTTSRRFASSWNRNGVVQIDLGKVPGPLEDLTTPAGRTQHLGDASRAAPESGVHRANKLAKGADEIVVSDGTIPRSAIRARVGPSVGRGKT